MPNKQALLESLAAVEEAAPLGLWNQNVLLQETPCGTVGCLAGWRVIQDGGKSTNLNRYESTDAVMEDGTQVDIWKYAQERFALTDYESAILFYVDNTLEDLRRMVSNLVNGVPIQDQG